ncbi:MAG: hypothetical protein ABSG85_01110 [Spirochaetia bacterium]
MSRIRKEQRMESVVKKIAFMGLAAAAVMLSSCMTVNRLDRYDFEGSRLAVDMRTPPEPRLNVDYDVIMDSNSPVISALSVMSNLAKANQAHRAREVMREALTDVDVPEIVRTESFSACAASLGAEQVSSERQSDYVLALQIDEWGIEARSPVSAVSLRIRLVASLYPAGGGELAWRREVTVDQPADPDMFGIGNILGNMVTATVLYNMTEEDLARGFRELASRTAKRVALILERDLDQARFGE